MLIQTITFYTTAILLITACFFAVISKRIIHSVLFSLVCFLLCGFLFFALNAPFIGAIQISIYAIALSILFAAAINLTDYKREENIKISPQFFTAIIGVFMLCFAIIFALKNSSIAYLYSGHLLTSPETAKQISSELLTHNPIAFELLGIYLLTALIGISVLFVFKGGR